MGGKINKRIRWFALTRFGTSHGEKGESDGRRTMVGMGKETRTATDWRVREIEDGLVDYFIRKRSDKRRTDEPLPSGCRGDPDDRIRIVVHKWQ